MSELIAFFGSYLLFGSAIWFWVATFILIGFFLLSEAEENGFIAFVSFGIYCGFNYFGGKSHLFNLFTTQNIFLYFTFGLVHAILRIYIQGIKAKKILAEKNNDLKNALEKPNNTSEIDGLKRNISSFKENQLNSIKSNVFRYWFLFPVSLIVWLLSDVVIDTYDVVYSFFSSFFNRIFLLGLGNENK